MIPESYLGWKIDFAGPRGEAAYLAPDSVHWRIYKNPVALGIGGVAAVLLEFADARIRSHDLHFDASVERGVVFHLVGALSEFGKLGMVCIGDNLQQAQFLYRKTKGVLDQEASAPAGT